jgi:hypothetical protein
MAPRNDERDRLFKAAVAARRHSIAVGMAAAIRAVNSAEGPSIDEIATSDRAEAACDSADQALLDYQRDHHCL